MKEYIDLHIHTMYSDGDKTPKQIIEMAKKIGLTTIAITDHNIVSGIKTLTKEDIKGIEFIPGVELSAKTEKARMHILGYGININDKRLNEKLDDRVDVKNILLYCRYLEKLFNIYFSQVDINELISRRGNIGRPEIAKLLIKYRFAKDIDEAFDKYLNPMMEECRDLKAGYTKEECIKMILEAGGIPVLAHPISLKLTEEELIEEIKYLKSIGLKGIETKHIHHTPEYTKMLEKIADDLDLLKTGGTDYHGEIKPNVKLGSGVNNNVSVTSSTMLNYLRSLKRV